MIILYTFLYIYGYSITLLLGRFKAFFSTQIWFHYQMRNDSSLDLPKRIFEASTNFCWLWHPWMLLSSCNQWLFCIHFHISICFQMRNSSILDLPKRIFEASTNLCWLWHPWMPPSFWNRWPPKWKQMVGAGIDTTKKNESPLVGGIEVAPIKKIADSS